MKTRKDTGFRKDDGKLRCHRCQEVLNPKRAIWLELNSRTGKYSNGGVPVSESQGEFAFGVACASAVLKGQEV